MKILLYFMCNFSGNPLFRPPSEQGNSNSGADVQALLAQQQQQTPNSQTTSMM